MKKLFVLLAALVVTVSVMAQDLNEGIRMVQYERFSKAKSILKPLAATDARANYWLGIAELGENNIDAAGAIFSKYPDDAANMAGMARVAFMKKNVTDGMRLAEAAADKAKRKDVEPYTFAADAITYTEGGDIQKAIEWYNKALEREDAVATRLALGDAQRKIPSSAGEAMTNWEKITMKDQKNSLAYSRIGSLWYGARQYDQALEAYQKAKDADPSNPLPYKDLANAYFYSGKFDLARQNIEKYLELSDKSCEDQIQYANVLYLNKDYGDAIKQMQQILGNCGDKPYPYRIIAFSQLEMDDSVNAIPSMRKYFSKQPENKRIPLDFKNYARMQLMAGNSDSSDFYYNKFILLDTAKDKASTYNKIADDFKALKTEEGYKKAGYWHGRVIKDNPNAPAIDYYNWGLYNYYGKDYDAAATAFSAMEAKYPDQPSATYWRARTAAATDPEAKTGAAIDFFKKWLAIPQTETYSPSAKDKILAYQYLLINAYNNDDKGLMKTYMDELRTLDPNDRVLKQIADIQAAKKK